MGLSGINKKNRRRGFCYLTCGAIMLLSLFGCASRTGKMQEETFDTELTEANEAPKDGEIIWTIPADYCDLDQYADKLNQKLSEDGYRFHVVFQYLPQNNYQAAVGKRLAEGTTDIAFLGLNSGGDNAAAALIREGNLEELTPFLGSDKGTALRDFYYEGVWDTVKVDGGIYSFPNQGPISGGSCFVFNKELFYEEDIAGFDGSLATFDKLVEILDGADLSQVEYPIISELTFMQIAEMSGYLYYYGAFISLETGEVFNPYETEEMKEMLSAIHLLYRKGFWGEDDGLVYGMDSRVAEQALSEMEFGVWISSYPDYVFEQIQDHVLCVRIPFALMNTVSAGTGVSRYAPNKEAALEFLALLYTNAEYGNLLMLGEEGVDYVLTDGYTYTMSGEIKRPFIAELVTGLFDNIHPSVWDDLPVNRHETRLEIYGSDARVDSVILGFQMNTEGMEDKIEAVCEVAEQYEDIWKRDDLESAIHEAAEAYRAAGGDQVV
ncbi:MAG: ABC transporter substrate-binding protein, partial [Lachnospiraceae bacterium]|nr:ABC transporter substrate-binding protein [Lachnospiraceae bacterium]